MKLKFLLESILAEIGDSVIVPNANYVVSQTSGNIKFSLKGFHYTVDIRLPIHQLKSQYSDINNSKITILVDFSTDEDQYNLTNQNQPLTVMANIVGGLTEWLNKWKDDFNNSQPVQIVYIKFNAKNEDESGMGPNKRTALYKAFIQKFARKYNTQVTFSGGTNEVFANFKDFIY